MREAEDDRVMPLQEDGCESRAAADTIAKANHFSWGMFMGFIPRTLGVALALVTSPAYAAVTYTLTSVPENPQARPPKFSLTIPDFAQDFEQFDASVFNYCDFGQFGSSTCTGIWFYLDGPGLGKLILIADNGAESFGYFPTYQEVGTYTVFPQANYISNTLVISGAPEVAEPESWALMIVGFGAIGSTLRRRKVTVSFG